MEWLPTLSEDVVNVACPAPLSVPVPSVVAPSLNVTVPVGFDPVTVAVKVTACPRVLGFCEDCSVVVVGAWPTTWLSGADVLVALLASPL
jgi:hypothetical protein